MGFGALAAVLTAIAAMAPGRRMPDWAVGLGSGSRAPAQAPLPVLGWVLAAIAGVAALAEGGVLQAAFATAIALAIPSGIVISLERFQHGASMTRAWAAGRNLQWAAEADAPEATPLLREGTYAYALNACSGELAPDLNGAVMHLASVKVDESAEGSSQTTRRFSVLHARVADPGARLPLCICAPRSRIPGYDPLDAMLKRLRRIDLASSAFEDAYELAIGKDGDDVWLRRLFEPTFVERHVLAANERIGWEIEGGALTVYRAGFAMAPRTLDGLVEFGALVAGRIGAEVGQTATG